MSTIFGILIDEGPPGVVVAADTQESKEENGKSVSKRNYFKIGNGKNWAMAWTGTWCKALSKFYGDLRKDNEKARKIIKAAIEKEVFEEILRLNQQICRLGDIGDTNAFILGTNYPEIGLYNIDEFGNMYDISKEDDSFFVAGSGEDEAKEVLEDQLSEEEVGSHRITLGHAILTAPRALEKAGRDIKTGGYPDLVVIDKDRVYPYKNDILKAMADALKEKFEDIAKRHTPPEKPSKLPAE